MADNQQNKTKNFAKFSSSNTQQNNFEFGKKMPQAVDLEEAVLGSILIDKDALIEIIDVLKVDHFYKDAHQHIYQSVTELFEENEPIDMVTVAQALRKNSLLEEVGGSYYLSYLTNRVASSANAKHYAHIVVQKALKRSLILKNTEVIGEAYEDITDVFDLLDKAEQNIYEISNNDIGKDYAKMEDLTMKAIREIEEMSENGEEFTGIPSGFTKLDRLTSGWQSSDLIIVAARPSMGKTAFTLNMARNAAVMNIPVAFFSLEMSATQLATRLISSEAELSQTDMKAGKLEKHQIQQIITKSEILQKAPIFIDDTPAINIFQLRAKCRRMKRKHDIQMVIIDYLQLMSGMGSNNRSMNREQEISRISRSLKTLAKELDIPVIALSQLSREVERRQVKRPMLSDLRESGAIEQDADQVIFLYRPEYYGQNQDEDGNSTQGLCEILIEKNRNGATGRVNLRFIKEYAKFTDMDGGAGFIPVSDLGNDGSYTVSSRMNSDTFNEDDSYDDNEDDEFDINPPF